MLNFTAHCLQFSCEVTSPLVLPDHPGSALRGALFGALRDQFCVNLAASSCTGCPHHSRCPVSFLLATVDDQASRGHEPPRPYVIVVPGNRAERSPRGVQPGATPPTVLATGETLTFGLTLFSQAVNLLPYLVLAVQRMGSIGLGRQVQDQNGRWRRGAMTLRQMVAVNPLTGEARRLTVADPGQLPDLPVTHQQVLTAADKLAAAGGNTRLALDFFTPTRLAVQGRVMPRPDFRVLVQRLLERLDALDSRFAAGGLDRAETYRLVGLADQVAIVKDQTRWVSLQSYSSRQDQRTSLSGFCGTVTLQGDLAPFLPYLIWGQLTHVGQDAVKGDGRFTLRLPEDAR